MHPVPTSFKMSGLRASEIQMNAGLRSVKIVLWCRCINYFHPQLYAIHWGANPGAPLPQVEKTSCQPPYPTRKRPTGYLGCGQQGSNHPPAGCMHILSHHPSTAQDLTFHDKPGSNSLSYALELGASMPMCGDGAYPSPACDCGADQQTVPPLSSPKWSPWLDWCWCRCSNSWVASQQVPRNLTISFGYLVSRARRKRRSESMGHIYGVDPYLTATKKLSTITTFSTILLTTFGTNKLCWSFHNYIPVILEIVDN